MSSIGAWWTKHPIPQVEHSGLLSLYTFSSKNLEQQVLTNPYATNNTGINPAANGASAAAVAGAPGTVPSSWTTAPSQRASQAQGTLAWTGSSVVQTLSSILLASLFPETNDSLLQEVRNAVTSKLLQGHLCRNTLNLTSSMVPPLTSQIGDKQLSTIFETYIGGIQRDLGTEKFGHLYTWYFQLIAPYANAYVVIYNTHSTAKLAPAPNSSEDSKLRRQSVAGFTSRLMEYAAKNKLSSPHFEFSNNPEKAGLQWHVTVSLDGRTVASASGSTKLEAKHLASRDALTELRAPIVGTQPGMGVGKDRRKEKWVLRTQQRGRGGIGHQAGNHHQAPQPQQYSGLGLAFSQGIPVAQPVGNLYAGPTTLPTFQGFGLNGPPSLPFQPPTTGQPGYMPGPGPQ